MKNKIRSDAFLVLTALCAVGLSLVSGCGKEAGQASVPPPHSPESYMRDKEFTGKMAAWRNEQRRCARERNELAERMRAKVEAMKARLKTSDVAVLKQELAKDPEWVDLYAKIEVANAKCEASRKAAMAGVRARVTPRKPTSK